MPAPTSPIPIRAALISVGGTPAPVLYTLRRHRPAHVWYFCSAGSRAIADQIHSQLDWHPDRDFIEVERFEELGPCYRELRQAIPELLRKWKVAPADVLVDYTGGTKTMSAALVLAATEIFTWFSYVGGEQREKGGLGITVDCRERILYQDNPWSELAIREIERARYLWAGCLFDTAGEILRATAARVPQRLRFEAMADVADAMAARHRLDFKNAVSLFWKASKNLSPIFEGRNNHGLLSFARQALELCTDCKQDSANPVLLRELLDNTLRTANQGRFEDAAARLYRAMEMQGQLWLAEVTQGAFQNGRLKLGVALPAPLVPLDFCQPDEHGDVKLSLEQLFRALAVLDHLRGRQIVADLALEKKSRWRAATARRNTSILAHGVSPISKDGFEQLKTVAAGFLDFALECEANPIPPFDPAWLS